MGSTTLLRRCSALHDLEMLTAGWSTPEIAATIDDPLGSLTALGPSGYSLAFLEHAEHRESAGLAVALTMVRREGLLSVGLITLARDPRVPGWEIGSWTLPAHRNRGYMSDARATLSSWALANGAGQLWAEAFDRRSASILEATGFEPLTGGGAATRVGARRFVRSALDSLSTNRVGVDPDR